MCLLGGYLVGAVAGPNTPDRSTATVASYQPSTDRLCLSGDGVKGQSGVAADGQLCGTWSPQGASRTPRKGDRFRFVSVLAKDNAVPESSTAIYGDVVK